MDPDGPDGPKKAPEPKANKMSGLKVIDEQTFEVTLAAPTAVFPTKLGYSAFMPLPDVFFTQKPEEFGKKPIANGPVKFVSWEDNVLIKLTRFDDYNLRDKMKVKDVDVKLYQDETAAYTDLLANNLDFMEMVPTSALAGDKWKTDLGDRGRSTTTPSTALIAFPLYDKRFQDPKLRRAVSLAINRQEISDKIFFGTRKPADSWANPLTPGAKAGNCTACKFDPDQGQAAAGRGRRLPRRDGLLLQRRLQPQGLDGRGRASRSRPTWASTLGPRASRPSRCSAPTSTPTR